MNDRFGEVLAALRQGVALSTVEFGEDDDLVGDAGVEQLASAISEAGAGALKALTFREQRLTDLGAKAIAEMLKRNSTITAVDLAYNEIGNEGMAALADALRTNATVE